jgi:hypothetical protein
MDSKKFTLDVYCKTHKEHTYDYYVSALTVIGTKIVGIEIGETIEEHFKLQKDVLGFIVLLCTSFRTKLALSFPPHQQGDGSVHDTVMIVEPTIHAIVEAIGIVLEGIPEYYKGLGDIQKRIEKHPSIQAYKTQLEEYEYSARRTSVHMWSQMTNMIATLRHLIDTNKKTFEKIFQVKEDRPYTN